MHLARRSQTGSHVSRNSPSSRKWQSCNADEVAAVWGPGSVGDHLAKTKMARIKRAIFLSAPDCPNLVAGIGFEPMTFRL